MTTRRHTIDIAAQGIDFAVMRNQTERMRQIPSGKSIGRKPLMHQCQSTVHALITEFWIKRADLIRQQHTFINNGA